MTILAVCGLKREAKIVSGPNVIAVTGGGDTRALTQKLDALHGDITGIISFGIAGALSPLLKAGDVVVAERIIGVSNLRGDDQSRKAENFRCDSNWIVALAGNIPDSHQGVLAGSDAIIETPENKAALFGRSGALAVDMESHIAARFATWRRVPLAGLRVISDDANHALPPAALVAMNPDGSIALSRVLASLLRRPWQVPSLIRTARDSGKAFRQLLRCRNLCGVGLAGPDR